MHERSVFYGEHLSIEKKIFIKVSFLGGGTSRDLDAALMRVFQPNRAAGPNTYLM